MNEQPDVEGIGNKRPKRRKLTDLQPGITITEDGPISTPTSVSSTRAEDLNKRGLDGAETRHGRTSQAAYRLAQQRGFTPGKELDDWLTAERDIDQQS